MVEHQAEIITTKRTVFLNKRVDRKQNFHQCTICWHPFKSLYRWEQHMEYFHPEVGVKTTVETTSGRQIGDKSERGSDGSGTMNSTENKDCLLKKMISKAKL